MQGSPSQREYWSGKVGDEWATHAERIDAMLAPLTDAALQLGAFRSGERVLDIGCGAGATTLEIARRVGATGSVVGVDLSPQLLSVAQSRASQAGASAEFMEADASQMRLDACFDAAFSRLGVMFFEDPIKAFAHIRTGICENGRLTFVCWRALAENVWATTPIEAIRPMLTAPAFASRSRCTRTVRVCRRSKDRTHSRWRRLADVVVSRWDERLSPLHGREGVLLPAACWLVSARV